eukprot:240778-Chlamydomonas_euryale.AAC.2
MPNVAVFANTGAWCISQLLHRRRSHHRTTAKAGADAHASLAPSAAPEATADELPVALDDPPRAAGDGAPTLLPLDRTCVNVGAGGAGGCHDDPDAASGCSTLTGGGCDADADADGDPVPLPVNACCAVGGGGGDGSRASPALSPPGGAPTGAPPPPVRSQGFGRGCVRASEGGRLGSGGRSLMSVRTFGGVSPRATISITSLNDVGYCGSSPPLV